MQSTHSLTAIIPVSRMSGRLHELRNTLQQVSRLEVILVHDIKDESTSEELHQLLTEIANPRIRILEGKFGSPGAARNAGLEEAKSEWITFWDSDDIALAEKYTQTIEGSSDGTEIYVCQYGLNFKSPVKTKIATTLARSLEDLAIELGLWRMMFKRDLIGGTRFSNILMGEDQLFFLQLLDKKPKLFFSDALVYSYSVGMEYQLTRDSTALGQLNRTFKELIREVKANPSSAVLFKRVIVLRQLISALSSSHVHKKMELLLIFCRHVFVKIEILGYLRASTLLCSKLIRRRLNVASTTVLNGGLGNQLFQLAFSLAQTTETCNLNASIGKVRSEAVSGLPDISHFWLPPRVRVEWIKRNGILSEKFGNYLLINELNPSYILKKLNKKTFAIINTSISYIFFKYRTKIQILDSRQKPNPTTSYLHFGYFQTAKWAEIPNVKQELEKLSAKEVSHATFLLIEQAKINPPIIMHMRFGDYLLESNFGNLSKGYYQKCLDEITLKFQNSPVWIFSDDETLSTEFLRQMGAFGARYIDTAKMNPAEILELMRYGSAFILANSSFSWWAAFLRHDSSAPVLAPSPWFKNIATEKNLIPTEWESRNADWS